MASDDKDGAPKAGAERAPAKSAPPVRLTAERYDQIKKALFDPEHQTQEDWYKAIGDMLAYVGKEIPGESFARVKEIATATAAASRKRKPQHQGRGFYFAALVDLFAIAGVPDGCERPTAEKIAAAHESDEIREELANRQAEEMRKELEEQERRRGAIDRN